MHRPDRPKGVERAKIVEGDMYNTMIGHQSRGNFLLIYLLK